MCRMLRLEGSKSSRSDKIGLVGPACQRTPPVRRVVGSTELRGGNRCRTPDIQWFTSLNDWGVVEGATMNIDQAMRVRAEGALRIVLRLAKLWKVWVIIAPVIVFLLGALEAHTFHTSRLFFVAGVLFLACMFLTAATLLIVGYLIPPPDPLSKHHSLVNRLWQYLRVVMNGVMFGIAAFWGAIVSVDVTDAVKSSGIEGVMEVGKSSLYPAILVAMFGLWVISIGLFLDVHRTDPEVVVSRCEGLVEKCFGFEGGCFCEWRWGHKMMRVFLYHSTRGLWAFVVAYFFPPLVLLLVMLVRGWIGGYFVSLVR